MKFTDKVYNMTGMCHTQINSLVLIFVIYMIFYLTNKLNKKKFKILKFSINNLT